MTLAHAKMSGVNAALSAFGLEKHAGVRPGAITARSIAAKAVQPALPPPTGVIDRVKNFGRGQWDAAKGLMHNTQGAFGGASGAHGDATGALRRGYRTGMVGNLKTLAPSLAIGAGGLYLAGRDSPEDKRHKQMQQMGY